MNSEEQKKMEKLKCDVVAIDQEHGIPFGYWGRIDFKTVRVEQFYNNLRVNVIFWQKIKEGDDLYCVDMTGEKEMGGLSVVVPPDYDLEWLREEFARACINRR